MRKELRQDMEDAAYTARQRSRLRESTGNAIALVGIILAIFVGALASSWMVGFVIAVGSIGWGAYHSYR